MKLRMITCAALVVVALTTMVPVFAANGTVTGTVTADTLGSPAISGALVRTDGDPSYSAITGSDGTYNLTAPTGAYDLLAAASGFIPQRTKITVVNGSSTRNFTLGAEGTDGLPINLPAPVDSGEPPAAPTAPGDVFPVRFAISEAQPVANAPAIAGWNETIKPDETFTLTGVRFTGMTGADAGSDTTVWVWAQTSDTVGVLRQAKIWSVDQYTIMATMPDDIPMGMYVVWVENANGTSAPVCMNRTIARWIGPLDNKAYAGQTKRVFGRNISQNHGTAMSFVYIQPAAGGTFTPCTVSTVDPYAVAFTVPEGTPNGSYKIYVHNGNGGSYGWADPLDLVVTNQWVRGTFTVALTPNGTDDTAQIQNACNQVSAQPSGGIVSLSAGNYIIKNTMTIPTNVEIKGAGMLQTNLLMRLTATGVHTVVMIAGNHVAFTDLTWKACTGYSKPGYCDIAGSGNYVKFTNFKMWADPGMDEQYAYSVGGLTELDRCEFYRNVSASWIHDSKLYGDFYWQTEAPVTLGGFSVLENNHMETKNWPTNPANGSRNYWDFMTPDQVGQLNWAKRMVLYGGGATCSYSANNTSNNCAVQDNRGEMWLFHGGPGRWFGNVLSSDGLTVTLRTDGRVDGQIVGICNYQSTTPNALYGGQTVPAWSQWSHDMLVITDGAGKGQMRHILDSRTSMTVTIDRPWKVQPDSTSRALITELYQENVIYNNQLNAFPQGYVQTSSASIGVTGSNCWGNIVEGNISHRTQSGRSFDGLSGGPVYWNQFRDEKAHEVFNGMYSFNYIDSNPVISTIVGNAFHGGEISVVGSATYGAGLMTGEGSVFEGVSVTAKGGLSLTGVAHGNWSGPQLNRGWTLYRDCSVTTIDGPASPLTMQPVMVNTVDDRQMLSGNTYSGGASQNYWLAAGQSAYSIPVALNRVARFNSWVGGTVNDVLVPIANAGIQSMNWIVTPSDSWITASIGANSSLGAESDLGRMIVNVNPSGLSVGRHLGYVDVIAGAKMTRVGVCFDLAANPPANRPPIAAFSATPTTGTQPLTVTFNAAASYDTDGMVSSYYWDFGDGGYGTGVTTSHVYATPGSYVPILVATDNQGATGSAHATVYVVQALGSVTLSGSPGAPVGVGTAITLSASSVGGYQAQYKFLVRQGSGGWATYRDYSTSSTCVWTPSTAAYYEVKMQAKTSDSTKVYDVTSNILGYPVGLIPVTGMAIWLKADAGVTRDGANAVSDWADQSPGSTKKVSQTTPAYKPIYQDNMLNGNPVIHFNGGASSLSTVQSVVTGSGEFTAFGQGRTTRIQGPSDQYFWWLGSNTSTGGYGQWIVYDGTTPFLGTSWGGPTNYLILPSSPTDNTWYRMCSRYASGSHGYWVDGTAVVGNTATGSNLASGFTVGNKSASAGNGLYGDVAEILIYSRNLSESERAGVDQYLQARWSPPAALTKDRIKDVKSLGDGVMVSLVSPKIATVTSGTYSDGGIYISESDRTCGMKITGAGSVSLWDNLTVTGTTDTDQMTGERVLRVTTVSKTDGTELGELRELGALGMSNKTFSASGQYVRVWGKVTAKSATYITLDDGGSSPVKVEVDGLVVSIGSLPAVGQYVSATGPAGLMAGGVTAVRVRSGSDIQVY